MRLEQAYRSLDSRVSSSLALAGELVSERGEMQRLVAAVASRQQALHSSQEEMKAELQDLRSGNGELRRLLHQVSTIAGSGERALSSPRTGLGTVTGQAVTTPLPRQILKSIVQETREEEEEEEEERGRGGEGAVVVVVGGLEAAGGGAGGEGEEVAAAGTLGSSSASTARSTTKAPAGRMPESTTKKSGNTKKKKRNERGNPLQASREERIWSRSAKAGHSVRSKPRSPLSRPPTTLISARREATSTKAAGRAAGGAAGAQEAQQSSASSKRTTTPTARSSGPRRASAKSLAAKAMMNRARLEAEKSKKETNAVSGLDPAATEERAEPHVPRFKFILQNPEDGGEETRDGSEVSSDKVEEIKQGEGNEKKKQKKKNRKKNKEKTSKRPPSTWPTKREKDANPMRPHPKTLEMLARQGALTNSLVLVTDKEEVMI